MNTVRVVITGDSAQLERAVSGAIGQVQRLAGVTRQAGTSLKDVFAGNVLSDYFQRGLSAATDFFSNAISKATDYQRAMKGLESVAAYNGIDAQLARGAVQGLAAVRSGLVTTGEAAEALKNFLKTGFNLEQSVALFNQFADAAAYGRSGTLGFGQAIVSAAQGVSTQSSELLNNVGIVTNLSTILERAGLTLDDLTSSTNGAAAKTALFNGLLKETAPAAGDAERAAQGYEGRIAKLKTAYDLALISLGDLITRNVALNAALDAGASGGDGASLADTLASVGPQIRDIATALVEAGIATAKVLSGLKFVFDYFSLLAAGTPALIRLTVASVQQAIVGGIADTINGVRDLLPAGLQSLLGIDTFDSSALRTAFKSQRDAARDEVEYFGVEMENALSRAGDRLVAIEKAGDRARAVAAQAGTFAPAGTASPLAKTRSAIDADADAITKAMKKLADDGNDALRKLGGDYQGRTSPLAAIRAKGIEAIDALKDKFKELGPAMVASLVQVQEKLNALDFAEGLGKARASISDLGARIKEIGTPVVKVGAYLGSLASGGVYAQQGGITSQVGRPRGVFSALGNPVSGEVYDISVSYQKETDADRIKRALKDRLTLEADITKSLGDPSKYGAVAKDYARRDALSTLSGADPNVFTPSQRNEYLSLLRDERDQQVKQLADQIAQERATAESTKATADGIGFIKGAVEGLQKSLKSGAVDPRVAETIAAVLNVLVTIRNEVPSQVDAGVYGEAGGPYGKPPI